MVRVRRNVLHLPPGDPTLYWYGRAIEIMQTRPITDPTSWRFLAAVHDYDPNDDPFAVPGEALPSAQIQAQFWRQCQHGSWFFLPWHRMYLYIFEQIVAAAVVQAGGPQGWALPYWNYSTDLDARLLPTPFRSPNLSDNNKNYLYVEEREPLANAGEQFAPDNDVELTTALTQTIFSDPYLSNFGGPPTRFSHYGRTFGQLENTPHNAMHDAIGGQTGWMGDLRRAALDPIFWLHHANIDRLWEVWLQRNPAHHNPTSAGWLSDIPFSFYNASHEVIVLHSADVVDTTALDYRYDDTSDPLAPSTQAVQTPVQAVKTEVAMSEGIPPELVGATQDSFQVENSTTHVHVPTPLQASVRQRRANFAALAPDATQANSAAALPHVLLQVENITASGRANSYEVYVNVPPGADPEQHPELRAGRLNLFGVAEASRATDQHAGSGLSFRLDITDMYHTLSAQPGWDPDKIRLSFVPVRAWQGATVTVGRVSLFFA